MWKKDLVTWRNVVWASKGAVRKAKAHLELNLEREIKDNKGFFKYISIIRKSRENWACC